MGGEGGRGGGGGGAERGRNATSLGVDPEVGTGVKRDNCADLRGRAATSLESLGFNHRSGGETSIPGTETSIPGTETSIPGTETSIPGTETYFEYLRGDRERRAAALLSSCACEALIRDTKSRQQHCASYVSRQATSSEKSVPYHV